MVNYIFNVNDFIELRFLNLRQSIFPNLPKNVSRFVRVRLQKIKTCKYFAGFIVYKSTKIFNYSHKKSE